MDTVKLGKTGLEVSRICFGTWQFGGDWAGLDRGEAIGAVRRALELGVNFFDTAQGYGWGESERLLAEALDGEDAVLATKGGLRMDDGQLRRDSSPGWLRKGVDESLRNLGVEAIDLYQVHWPDADTPFEETRAALDELVDAGKIRHVGVSNFGAEQMDAFGRVETLQPPYHLFRRDIEQDVLPWCADNDVGVLIYGPLAHGLLSGRMTTDTRPEEGDWRSGSDLFQGEAYERNLAVVEELKRVAEDRDMTVAQLAVAWTLSNPAVHVAIVGARRPDHIEGVAPAGSRRLDEDDLAAIEAAMESAVRVGGPSPEAV